MHVPFVDLRAQHASLRGQIDRALADVTAESAFILGPAVTRFENAAAAYLGVKSAVAVSSGTDALLMALVAIGVRPNDVVITTAFSFISTAEVICRLGAKPRFVDLDATSLSFDRELLDEALSHGARAVLPVHLYGRCEGIAEITRLAARYGVDVIEDAAQAFGSRAAGLAAGAWGRIGCFSFFPTKVLGAMGDAGLVVTGDAELGERCRRLRQHGLGSSGEYVDLGGNFRMDSIQAAVLAVKLEQLERWIQARRRHASAYDVAFTDVSGLRLVRTEPLWNGAIYTVRVDAGLRDALRVFLADRGVETKIYYPRALHLEPALAGLALAPDALPVSEGLSREVLSLPVHPEMTAEQRSVVIDAVLSFFRRG